MRLDKVKPGDTIIEVALSVAVFAAVALFSVNMMNSGLNKIQRTLETTMARTAIDSQTEALRFIHNNYLAERNFADSTAQFQRIWEQLKEASRNPRDIKDGDVVNSFDVNSYTSCDQIYSSQGQIQQYKAFVINPRYIVPDYGDGVSYNGVRYTYGTGSSSDDTGILKNIIIGGNDTDEQSKIMTSSDIYPRIIFGNRTSTQNTDNSSLKEANIFQQAESVQGIWDIVVYSNERNKDRSEYFDFYIRTCWNAAGTHVPSTITTIVRLYNPEVIE